MVFVDAVNKYWTVLYSNSKNVLIRLLTSRIISL